jgi:hypothetical protein
MVAFWKRLFASPPPPQAPAFAVASGAPQIIDPLMQWTAERLYAPLRREDRLTLYHTMYYSMPLAHGAVEVLTKLVNTTPVFKSGNAAVDARARQIWAEINGHQVNESLVRQHLIYGYSVGESVYPTMRRVERVTVPESPMMRFKADKSGVITDAVQVAGTIYAPNIGQQKSKVPASKCIILRRDPVSTFDYYGGSLFESAVDTLIDLSRALHATVSVAMRIGKPRLLVTIPAEGLTPEQFRDRMDKAMQTVAKLNRDETTDIGLPLGCDIKVIGSETFTPFEKELWSLKEMLCAGFTLPPLLLNILTTSGQGSESVGRQVVIQLQTILSDIQESNAAAWNSSFWPLVAKLEGMPVVPVMEFQFNRLLEQLVEEEGRAAQFAQDALEVAWGIREDEWLAQQCGATGIVDPTAFNQMVDALRESAQPPKQEPNSPETNKNGQTKVTDAQASKRTTG